MEHASVHGVPFRLEDLRQAYSAYQEFLGKNPPAHHARYIFPFFSGSYFVYRKVDVKRVVAVTNAIGKSPSYIDVGCGYGDFLANVRSYLPQATGIEKEAGIFEFAKRPEDIRIVGAEQCPAVDVAFIGWMEPGADFRSDVAKSAKCVITTFDAGGQCGINGGCEYDEFWFDQIAWWRTPSWIDVNTELMNRYYTPSLTAEKKQQLAKLRGAHNFWYIYARQDIAGRLRDGLKAYLAAEDASDRYDFESVLDECGFGYMEELSALTKARRLWEVMLD
jgi:SAM-dependent methyltransferase